MSLGNTQSILQQTTPHATLSTCRAHTHVCRCVAQTACVLGLDTICDASVVRAAIQRNLRALVCELSHRDASRRHSSSCRGHRAGRTPGAPSSAGGVLAQPACQLAQLAHDSRTGAYVLCARLTTRWHSLTGRRHVSLGRASSFGGLPTHRRVHSRELQPLVQYVPCFGCISADTGLTSPPMSHPGWVACHKTYWQG